MSKQRKNSINEKPLRASGPDFDRFVNSTIWYDMQNLIKDRVEYLQAQMLTSTQFDEMRNLQGQMTAWKEMLGLPSYLKTCAHSEEHANQSELELEEHGS